MSTYEEDPLPQLPPVPADCDMLLNKEKFACDLKLYAEFKDPVWFNLKLYPILGVLERLAGLLIDLRECFEDETKVDLSVISSFYASFWSVFCYKKFRSVYVHPSVMANINEAACVFKNTRKLHVDASNVKIDWKISEHSVVYLDPSPTDIANIQKIQSDLATYTPFCLAQENKTCDELYTFKFRISDSVDRFVLYVPDRMITKFTEQFKYFLSSTDNLLLEYDNLINLCIMVKNGGDVFKQMLEENLPYIDRWTILDTGSTDDTIKNINSILVGKKKGRLYEEPFINFRESRNRCLDLAGTHCKYNIMLDDTYVIKGNLRQFLRGIRSDQFADSYSLMIQSNDNEYYSNRITKSKNKLRYIYTIHEVIQKDDNINVVVPVSEAFIYDMRAPYMEERTMSRKEYDLKCLFDMVKEYPDDPRHLYYIGQTYNLLNRYEEAAEYFYKRVFHPQKGFNQERIDALFEMTRIYNFKLNKPWEECEKYYNMVYEFDNERPEGPYFIAIHYYLEGDSKKAYEYFKKAFTVGYPLHRQYSLKPTLSYYFCPKLLAPFCYQFEDFKLGLEATELFLMMNDPNREFKAGDSYTLKMVETVLQQEPQTFKIMQDYHKIFSLLKPLLPLKASPEIPKKPIVAFVVTEPVTQVIREWIQQIAFYIMNINQLEVYVFSSNPIGNLKFHYKRLPHNVKEFSLNEFYRLCSDTTIAHCIVTDAAWIPVAIHSHVESVYWLASTLEPSTLIVSTQPKLKKVFCLSEGQKQQYISMFPTLSHLVCVVGYGVDEYVFMPSSEVDKQVIKSPYSFFAASSSAKAVEVILTLFGKFLDRFPKATLTLVTSFGIDTNFPKAVKVYSSLTDDELAKVLHETQVWLCPFTEAQVAYPEVLQAGMTKTLFVTSLDQALDDSCIVVKGDPTSVQWQKQAVQRVSDYLQNKSNTNYIKTNFRHAVDNRWLNVCIDLHNSYLLGLNQKLALPNYKTSKIDYEVKGLGTFKVYDEDDYISNFIKQNQPWEPEIIDILDTYGKDEGVALDIGAFIGTHTVAMAKRFKQVFAFEPFPTSFELLKYNVARNNCSNVTLVHKAVGNKAQIHEKLYVTSQHGFNVGCTRYEPIDQVTTSVDCKTEEVTLDKYFESFDKPINFIKIDVEGYEANVIQGALKIIAKHKPIICVEDYYNHPYPKLLELGYERVKDTQQEINSIYVPTNSNQRSINTTTNVSLDEINQRLNYANMYNWTNDLPSGYNAKQTFEKVLKMFEGYKSLEILEVGTFAGTSLINMLQRLPQAKATAIDSWTNYIELVEPSKAYANSDLAKMEENKIEQIFQNNLKIADMSDRVVALKGDSVDRLLQLVREGKTFDFIYVDGSHKLLDCYADCVLAWSLLKPNGILAIDDVPYLKENMLESPYEGVMHFVNKYKKKCLVVETGYRVFLRKV